MSLKKKAAKIAEELIDDALRVAVKRKAKPETLASIMDRLPPEAVAVKRVVKPAEVKREPRLEPRKKEQPKVEKLAVGLSERRAPEPAKLSVFDLEGKPFITSMSDLSAGGDDVLAVNDVVLPEPVKRMGGQDYMFDAPGSVWASDLGPAGRHLALARELRRETGQDPLFLPWQMGPRAIDFAHMPRELMLRYASEALGARDKKRLTKDVRGIVSEFRALDDPASVEMFREAVGGQRAALNRLLDQYRERGGLGMGEARWAMTDTEQLGRPLTSLYNVGEIDARGALAPSSHPSYRTALPGGGVGRLEEEIGALELLPELMAEAGIDDPFSFPVGKAEPGTRSPLRAMQMAPKGGIITDKKLRKIEERLAVKKAKKKD